MSKSKLQIPQKYKKKKVFDHYHLAKEGVEEVDFDEVIPFNMSFLKLLVELQVLKQSRQLPTMELYDGSSDPNDHLLAFESVLLYKGASTSIMCRTFLLSLKSTTLKWFQSLPSRSIDLWLDLREKFRPAYATNKERLKTKANLKLIDKDMRNH